MCSDYILRVVGTVQNTSIYSTYVIRAPICGRLIVISLSICPSVCLSILKSICPSKISCPEHIFSYLGQIWLILHQLLKGVQWPWIILIGKRLGHSRIYLILVRNCFLSPRFNVAHTSHTECVWLNVVQWPLMKFEGQVSSSYRITQRSFYHSIYDFSS